MSDDTPTGKSNENDPTAGSTPSDDSALRAFDELISGVRAARASQDTPPAAAAPPAAEPEPATEDYLAFVLSRLTFPGSLYLGLIALLPSVAFIFLDANQNFPFGGTSILIIVGVGLDTVKQIESQLQQRNYEGFLR